MKHQPGLRNFVTRKSAKSAILSLWRHKPWKICGFCVCVCVCLCACVISFSLFLDCYFFLFRFLTIFIWRGWERVRATGRGTSYNTQQRKHKNFKNISSNHQHNYIPPCNSCMQQEKLQKRAPFHEKS